MASSILSRLQFIIGADNRQFLSSIQQSQKKIAGFTTNITSFAKIAGGALAGISIGSFAADIVNLSQRLKGVQVGFSALNRPGLLSELRKATRGTVDDLELMRQSVRADNFQIPLEKLAGAFEFARKRAAATGEDVNFLVNSIIDGIGRKSTLVLDNLGISASQLQDEIKKTGDFAVAAFNLIEAGAQGMPAALDEAVDATQQLQTVWTNIKIAIADGVIPAINDTGQAISNIDTQQLQNDITLITKGLIEAGKAALNLNFGLIRFLRGFKLNDPNKFFLGEGAASSIIEGVASTGKPASEEFIKEFQSGLSLNFSGSSQLIPGLQTGFRGLLRGIYTRASAEEGKEASRIFFEEVNKVQRLFASGGLNVQPGGTFGTFTDRSAAETFGAEALARLDKTVQPLPQATEKLNESLANTLNLSSTLTSSFQGLFDTILRGGASADDIFKQLFSTILSAVTGGIFGGIFDSIFKGGGGGGGATNNAFVIPGGHIKLSQTISTRNRNFTGGF